jgi:hypothetical protein
MRTQAPSLSDDQREAIAYAMSMQELNKCVECCLVPGCYSCGPCDDHDEPTEATAAMAWVDEHRHLY